jgi:archaellum component FlaG (FlaF/FlaG flagellin family)
MFLASGVASQVILFIAVIGITTGLVAVFNNYVDETSSSTRTQWQMMSNNLKTDVTITSIDYKADSPDNTTIYVLNTGKIKLDVNETDIYLDGFISRDGASRNMVLEASTDVFDVGIWNEKEVLKIVVFKDLSASTTYQVCITTQYGTKTCDSFSTS